MVIKMNDKQLNKKQEQQNQILIQQQQISLVGIIQALVRKK